MKGAKSHDAQNAATRHEHLLEQTDLEQLTCCECFAVFVAEPGTRTYRFDLEATTDERFYAAQEFGG